MSRVLLSSHLVQRIIDRLAAQVIERNRGTQDLVVLGLRTRGWELGQVLAAAIEMQSGAEIETAQLHVSAFRDDRIPSEPIRPKVDVDAKRVLIVDDVLYTGRTIRAALDAVVHWGRPNQIQLAALVDRGHREVPIQADFAGRVIPTSQGARVRVDVESGFQVILDD